MSAGWKLRAVTYRRTQGYSVRIVDWACSHIANAYGGSMDGAKRRARLIAAAPDLLALAERVCSGFVDGESAEDTLTSLMAEARACIAKAVRS